MKLIFFIVGTLLMATSISSAKSLVVYFSATGTTKQVSEKVAKLSGSDIAEIKPKVLYTNTDLDWHDNNSRTTKECKKNRSIRPEIANAIDITNYDKIYIGYPIWWGEAPNIIYTFIEGKDLTKKVMVPFCTSGGSGIGSSSKNLKKVAPKASWRNGKCFYADPSDNDIRNLINE